MLYAWSLTVGTHLPVEDYGHLSRRGVYDPLATHSLPGRRNRRCLWILIYAIPWGSSSVL